MLTGYIKDRNHPMMMTRGWSNSMLMRLKNVHTVRTKGTTYYYHRPTKTRLKAPLGSPEFVQEVERLNAKCAAKPEPVAGTLGSLITLYRGSPEYRELANLTKRDYNRIFDWLVPISGRPLVDITSPFVIKLRDKADQQKKFRFANYVVAVLSLLFNWGKPRGYIDGNPAGEVGKIKRPRGMVKRNRAWKPEELATVMAEMPAELRVAIALGAYAAIREGDVVRLPWSAYDGSALEYRQGKTGETVWIPVHRELRAALDATPRRSPVIVVGERGAPFTEDGFRARFFRVIRSLTAEGRVAPGLTFHGLRHTAATALADAGCSTRDIMAVTGHKTEVQPATYTATADRKRRFSAAIQRLEETTENGVPVKPKGGNCKTVPAPPAKPLA